MAIHVRGYRGGLLRTSSGDLKEDREMEIAGLVGCTDRAGY